MNSKALSNPFNGLNFIPYSLGFDDQFDRISKYVTNQVSSTGFPPYNIRKEGNKYFIDLAVAGLNREDMEVEVNDNVLTIKSTWDEKMEPFVGEYLHKGLSFSKFTRKFDLADNVMVLGSTLQNGILTVALEKVVPEHMKPKKIAIT